MEGLKKLNLSTFRDERGALTVVEMKDYVDWPVKRVYFLTEVSDSRGGHCVKGEKKMYICQKGSCKARFHDGNEWKEFELNGPDDAILMDEEFYRDFIDFSQDAVLMAISSVNYVPKDYIYDLEEFIKYKKS